MTLREILNQIYDHPEIDREVTDFHFRVEIVGVTEKGSKAITYHTIIFNPEKKHHVSAMRIRPEVGEGLEKECPRCNGEGKYIAWPLGGNRTITCDMCGGTGHSVSKP